ncbi:MAG: DMT family transporter [Anaerolineae bacterium]|nr:DMT family transporter [Anaerolineae bacterium]
MTRATPWQGIAAALASAMFLGVVPIFGKISISAGFSPLMVVATRTGIAALLMTCAMAIAYRRFFYIYPVGLVGCLLAGILNGLGSILYYTALSRLNAGIAQMLYSLYPLFVALWLFLDRQPITRLTAFRLGLSIPAVIMLLQTNGSTIDIPGAVMVVCSSALYGLHLIINQRVIYDVPAPTVTLYTILGMAGTVLIGYTIFDRSIPAAPAPWWPVISMAFITFLSRFTLFLGLKKLGGLQTALLGLGEIFLTVFLSILFLGESLNLMQWIGGVLLALSLILVGFDRIPPQKRAAKGWLSWLNPPALPAPDITWRSQP